MGREHIPNRVTINRTTGDQTKLLYPSHTALLKNDISKPGDTENILVDSSIKYQSIVGFGAALTDASAHNIWQLIPEKRDALMTELFSPLSGIGLSCLRVPVGASDFATSSYTYNDRPWPRRDRNLDHFSIDHDLEYIIPLLKQALILNPKLSIIASPWSAPGWMKHWRRLKGGRLKTRNYDIYAQYLVRFITAYRDAGIPIYAITVQNEPGHSTSKYPSMTFTATTEAKFITEHLAPAFVAAGIKTKILGFDHNWSTPEYPEAMLENEALRNVIGGIAWHGYGGDVSAQSRVHNKFPSIDTYFTEITGSQGSSFDGDLGWGMHNIIIGTTNNHARTALYWNLALDEHNGPINGGYTEGRGVVTIRSKRTEPFLRNVEYYTLAHASKFIQPEAIRIGSKMPKGVEGVCFVNPDQSRAIIIRSTNKQAHKLKIHDAGHVFKVSLGQDEVITCIWRLS